MNTKLSAKLKSLPISPGVYLHKSNSGEVIYVGKAAVLRNRVRQYFQDSRLRDAKTTALVAEIYDTDWIETESEVDALFLESELVKRYMPRYNVLLRDDKSQSFVRIDMKSDWPTVTMTRNPADDGAEYFGPFYNGFALKKALRYLRKIYPYFITSPDKQTSKLEVQIGLNPDKNLGSEMYKQSLRQLISYIKGNRKALTKEIESNMKSAASSQDFEKAAKLRNKLNAMRELQQRVMFGDREFLDISKDKAMSDIVTILGIKIPVRIEGFDISHHAGADVVSSMVVFINGVSSRADYRKFKMTSQTNDDPKQIYETIFRRFSEKNKKSWGLPDLVIIDGGKPQLSAAIKAINDQSMQLPIISIAKRDEEIVLSKSGSMIDQDHLSQFALNLPAGVSIIDEGDFSIINLHVGQRNLGSHTKNLRGEMTPSPYADVIKLIQRIRDESHRFAINYHTTLARKRQVGSRIDDIAGIGPATKRKLIKHFGSVRGVTNASEQELSEIVGKPRAKAIKAVLG